MRKGAFHPGEAFLIRLAALVEHPAEKVTNFDAISRQNSAPNDIGPVDLASRQLSRASSALILA